MHQCMAGKGYVDRDVHVQAMKQIGNKDKEQQSLRKRALITQE